MAMFHCSVQSRRHYIYCVYYFNDTSIKGLFHQFSFATCAQPDLPAGISVRAVVAELVDAQR